MTREEIAAKVKQIIVDKLTVDPSEVTEEASFTNDLGADSLDMVDLIMEFEKTFNISIPDEAAEKISTVGEAIDYLAEHVK
jgi:acyl carrier protein